MLGVISRKDLIFLLGLLPKSSKTLDLLNSFGNPNNTSSSFLFCYIILFGSNILFVVNCERYRDSHIKLQARFRRAPSFPFIDSIEIESLQWLLVPITETVRSIIGIRREFR